MKKDSGQSNSSSEDPFQKKEKRVTMRSVRRFWKKNHWFFIGFTGIVGIFLGYIGYYKYLGKDSSAFDILYYTVQLFVLEFYKGEGSVPLELNIARFLLPLLTLYTISTAILITFGEQIKLFKIRRLRNHIVICGIGSKGLHLAKDFRQKGQNVVLIEINENNNDIVTCEDLGAHVLVGDATHINTLQLAGIKYAKALIAITNDDNLNAEIAMNAYQTQGTKKRIKCFIHVMNKKFCEVFEKSRKWDQSMVRSDFKFFNVFDHGARLLLRAYPPDKYSKNPDYAHIVVVGFGNLGESVVLQSLKIGHYADGKKLIITVLDEDMRTKRRLFMDRHTKVDNISDIELQFFNTTMGESGFIDTSFFFEFEEKKPDIFYICLDTDARNLTSAFHLYNRIKDWNVPLIINIIKDEGFTSILKSRESDLLKRSNMYMFPTIQEACKREIVLGENLDFFAKLIHQSYVKERIRSEGKRFNPNNPNHRPWDELWETLKDSNRLQADHIDIKLRALNCVKRSYKKGQKRFLDKGESIIEKIVDKNDRLAIMEHNRWVSERYLDGWEKGKEDRVKKISPYLIEWDGLPEPIRDLDREAVLNMPRILASAKPNGFKIVKSE